MKQALFLILFAYSIIGFIFPVNSLFMYITGLGLTLMSVRMLAKTILNKNFLLFVIMVFMFSYYVEPVGYLLGFSNHIHRIMYTAESPNTVFITSQCLFLFLLVLSALVKFKVPDEMREVEQTIVVHNQLGFWIALGVATVCVILGVSGDTIFESGGYTRGNLQRSSIFEYSIIFIVCALIYARTGSERKMVYIICALLAIKDLLYGGRVNTIMMLLAVFFVRFLNRYKFNQVLIGAICAYIFFSFWGAFRGGLNASSFKLSFGGNASDVTYASMRVHFMMDRDILPIEDRLKSFIYFVASIFVPYKYLPDLANLSLYKQSQYWSGGGGLISTFFYCWGYIPGLLAIAVWVSKSINSFFYSNSIYWKFYAILVAITTPRWFAYYPIQIFKYAFYGVIVFYILNNLVQHSTEVQQDEEDGE